MKYALNELLLDSPVEGAIEISESQYAAGLIAKTTGRGTTVIDGEFIIISDDDRDVYSCENRTKISIPANLPTPDGYTDIQAPSELFDWDDGWELNFERAFNDKQLKIVLAYKDSMNPITGSYTPEDIASFPTQEAEAKAWQADNNADTPLLDFMVANRPSIDKPTLVSRILANSVLYKQVAGPAIGKKQHFEDLLYALKAQHEDPNQPDATQADFDAIVVDFS